MTLKANWFQTNVSPLVDARDERRLLRALAPRGGVLIPGDFQVVPVGAGTTLTVQVNACSTSGGAIIPGQDTHQGSYFAYLDAATQVTHGPADPTNPRIDTVVLRIYDDEAQPGIGFACTVEIVPGVPAAAPVAPAIPRDSLALADVRINVGQTGVAAGSITDRRVNSSANPLPRGIICSGPVVAAPPVNTLITLNTVIAGAASWLSAPATSIITVPVGAGGLYLIQLDMDLVNSSVAANSIDITDGAGNALGMMVRGQVGPTAGSFWTGRMSGSWLRPVADGATFKLLTRSNAPTSWQAMRFSLVRLGDGLAAA